MKFHKSLAGLALAVGSFAMMSAPAFANMTLKAADVHPEGYPNVVAMQHLGQKLETATNVGPCSPFTLAYLPFSFSSPTYPKFLCGCLGLQA